MKKQRNSIFPWELENVFTVAFNSANDCNRKELIDLDIPFLNYHYYNLLLKTDSINPTYQVTCSVCSVFRNNLVKYWRQDFLALRYTVSFRNIVNINHYAVFFT